MSFRKMWYSPIYGNENKGNHDKPCDQSIGSFFRKWGSWIGLSILWTYSKYRWNIIAHRSDTFTHLTVNHDPKRSAVSGPAANIDPVAIHGAILVAILVIF